MHTRHSIRERRKKRDDDCQIAGNKATRQCVGVSDKVVDRTGRYPVGVRVDYRRLVEGGRGGGAAK